MREIKFRGQTISREWLYGNLAMSQQKICNVDAGTYISNGIGLPFAYKVVPDTVGQFVGVYDKNNVEIYEDDIVAKFDFQDPYFRSVVVQRIGAFGYTSEGEFVPFALNYHFGWVNNKSMKIEVVGNRFDNYELSNETI